MHARRYGVPVRFGRDAHRRVETAVTLLREGGETRQAGSASGGFLAWTTDEQRRVCRLLRAGA